MGLTLGALLAMVVAEDLNLQLDIKTAFFNGELGEEGWIEQPEGWEQGDARVLNCGLLCALYTCARSCKLGM